MSTLAIFWIGLFALLAVARIAEEVGSVLRARAKACRCPCRDLSAVRIDGGLPGEFVPLRPGEVVTLPPGEPASAETAARKVH
ncbi:MAG TPA: hypothetical protein VK951_11205 [Miltoncostaeaceae bacterium]|nr:hypothetical protein [Miltoncostaeaceae bacterium]